MSVVLTYLPLLWREPADGANSKFTQSAMLNVSKKDAASFQTGDGSILGRGKIRERPDANTLIYEPGGQESVVLLNIEVKEWPKFQKQWTEASKTIFSQAPFTKWGSTRGVVSSHGHRHGLLETA